MRDDTPFFDDMLKLAGNLARGLMEKAKEGRTDNACPTPLKALLQNLTASLNVATRDEMDAAMTMMAKIRTKQDDIEARLDNLEGKSKPKKRPTLRPASSRKAPARARKKKR